MTSPYYAKYFAHELARQAQPGRLDRSSMVLFRACVDRNLHEIGEATVALRSPLPKGAVLSDEVWLDQN